ncbi:unnamed protein product [Cercospora beticola]|nr:unnamed protein product [Cercospora beticola]
MNTDFLTSSRLQREIRWVTRPFFPVHLGAISGYSDNRTIRLRLRAVVESHSALDVEDSTRVKNRKVPTELSTMTTAATNNCSATRQQPRRRAVHKCTHPNNI